MFEAEGIPLNEGIASVESEGGLRRAVLKPPFGPEGSPGVGRVVIFVEVSCDGYVANSWLSAASKARCNLLVRIGSGTIKFHFSSRSSSEVETHATHIHEGTL